MKILQLCKKFPYPLKDGECIAVTYLTRALHRLGCEITLLSMNTTKHHTNLAELPDSFDHYEAMHVIEVDNRPRVKDALLNLFSRDSYHITRFVSQEFQQRLVELLQANDYDVVQLETLYLAPYVPAIRRHSRAKIALRSHNVEHEIWERAAANMRFGPLKFYLQLITRRLKTFEIEHLNRYDWLVAITERDLKSQRTLGCELPAHVAPIGLELDAYTAKPHPASYIPTVAFLGALDWLPNVDGLRWLLNKVWPRVREHLPQAELHVAGRHTPQWLLNLQAPGVVVHGEVPSASEFLGQHGTLLVPLFSGSGMRAKIIEGMALGRAVITTSLGLEGIHARHEQEVLVADDTEAFVRQVVHCLEQPAAAEELGRRARAFVAEEFDNMTIGSRLLDFYRQQLSNTQVGV